MKTLKSALLILLLVAGLVFAATNTMPVTLSLWPFAFAITAPLFVVFAFGVALGFGISWTLRAFRALPEWQARRAMEKELAGLRQERDALKARAAPPETPPPAA